MCIRDRVYIVLYWAGEQKKSRRSPAAFPHKGATYITFKLFVVGAQDKTWECRLSSVFRADGIRRIPLTASSWGQKGSPSISGLGRTRCLQWKRLPVNSCSAAPIGLVPLCACAVSFSLQDHHQMNPCAARSFLGGEVAHSRSCLLYTSPSPRDA